MEGSPANCNNREIVRDRLKYSVVSWLHPCELYPQLHHKHHIRVDFVSTSDIHGINLSSSNIMITCDNSCQWMAKERTENIHVYEIFEVNKVSLVCVLQTGLDKCLHLLDKWWTAAWIKSTGLIYFPDFIFKDIYFIPISHLLSLCGK